MIAAIVFAHVWGGPANRVGKLHSNRARADGPHRDDGWPVRLRICCRPRGVGMDSPDRVDHRNPVQRSAVDSLLYAQSSY